MKFIILFLISFFISTALTPLMRKFCLKTKIGIDYKSDRKVHQKRIITRLGGVAIFFSFFLSLSILYFFVLEKEIFWFFRNYCEYLLGFNKPQCW
ncbi:MAG: hypothetical protein ABIG09_02005 [bacterium]